MHLLWFRILFSVDVFPDYSAADCLLETESNIFIFLGPDLAVCLLYIILVETSCVCIFVFPVFVTYCTFCLCIWGGGMCIF